MKKCKYCNKKLTKKTHLCLSSLEFKRIIGKLECKFYNLKLKYEALKGK